MLCGSLKSGCQFCWAKADGIPLKIVGHSFNTHTHMHTVYGMAGVWWSEIGHSWRSLPTHPQTYSMAFTKFWGEGHTFQTLYVLFLIFLFFWHPAPVCLLATFTFYTETIFWNLNFLLPLMWCAAPQWLSDHHENPPKNMYVVMYQLISLCVYIIFVHKRHINICK